MPHTDMWYLMSSQCLLQTMLAGWFDALHCDPQNHSCRPQADV